MKCKVESIHKNRRYKILRFNEAFYIVDMDRSFWLIFFPFAFWFLPHYAFQISKESYKRIQITQSEQMSVGSLALLGGGISVLFVNLLKPLFYQLNIQTTLGVNIIVLSLIIMFSLLARFYIHKRLSNDLQELIDINKIPKVRINVSPNNKDYILKYSLSFLFSWSLAFLFGYAFVLIGNLIVLLGCFILLYLGLILNLQAIPNGYAKVHIK